MMGFKDRIGKGYKDLFDCLSEQWWDLKFNDAGEIIRALAVLANNDGI